MLVVLGATSVATGRATSSCSHPVSLTIPHSEPLSEFFTLCLASCLGHVCSDCGPQKLVPRAVMRTILTGLPGSLCWDEDCEFIKELGVRNTGREGTVARPRV